MKLSFKCMQKKMSAINSRDQMDSSITKWKNFFKIVMKACHFLPLYNGLTCNNKWCKMNGHYKRIYDYNNYTSPMKSIGCYPHKRRLNSTFHIISTKLFINDGNDDGCKISFLSYTTCT
jgi:hypothetical protein